MVCAWRLPKDSLQQVADRAVLLDRVTQMCLGVDHVVITSALSGAFENAGLLELID